MNIDATLEALEQSLLSGPRRRDPNFLHSVLADEFREFGSSGKVFSRTEIIAALQTESRSNLSLTDFRASLLSQDFALVTYRVVKTQSDLPPIPSLRSSVWIFRDKRWQILFHQGTRIP